ncbi:F0F1 ATP synthase subunit delta [Methylotetracoccus oryzae]|uniref:F0F1 ATP synthase subunit delta n=1 Tax=Methylotetracoccus oryzae TaxID=1919059 RepID=UPI00111BA67B|nr:F0F1 ATP synthase subunit delta [Methylotetracoccus oryzae]
MGFNPWTFLLEVINFLILVWILGRFLYRPVAAVIEERRRAIASSLNEAAAQVARSEALERQYAERLSAWEQEKRLAREQWLADLNVEKTRLMDAFRQGLEAERQQADILAQRRLSAQQSDLEQQSLELGGRFAARLLERVAGPELEARLLDLFIDDLSQVPEERWEAVTAQGGDGGGRARLMSAFPLGEQQRADLQQALSAQLGHPIACDFITDPGLIAGLRFELGPLLLHANLHDELEFFRLAE